MSDSGYTPTTEEILDDLHERHDPIPDGRAGSYVTARRLTRSERVRWLAAHDAEVAAKTWDEGAQFAAVECGAIDDEKQEWVAPGDNPYRDQIGENK